MTPSRSPVLKTRELDALIAEKVFGFRREGQPKDYDGNFGGEPVLLPPSAISWEALESILPKKGRMALTYFVPKYSTDIAKSFLVVEQMRERDFTFSLDNTSLEWLASFAPISLPSYGVWVKGKSAAEVICRAALTALGFDPPEGVQR